MASLVSQTTATTSFGDLSLSALENLRYIVSALTTNHEVGQPLNLADARRFRLDTYFQNLLKYFSASNHDGRLHEHISYIQLPFLISEE